MPEKRDFNLAGKDYFTEEEAAHYACVSYSQFRKCAEQEGLYPVQWMGKRVFRRTDIQRAIERNADAQSPR